MDFQAVLERVCFIEDLNAGHCCDNCSRLFVDRHVAQRRPECLGAAQRDAAKRYPVARSQQDHPSNAIADRLEQHIRTCGNRPGIYVAGMRRDQRFWHDLRRPRGRQMRRQRLPQCFGVIRVKKPGYSRLPDPSGT